MFKALAVASLILAAGPEYGPSDKMFDELQNAPSEEEGKSVALDIWAAWMESGSPTVDILMERAVNAQAAGDNAFARALYDKAILIKPDYAEAYNRRATLFLNEQNYPEALRDLNEALTHEPRHFGAWLGLGRIFEALGADKEALNAYREALAIYPEFPEAKAGAERLAKTQDGTAL